MFSGEKVSTVILLAKSQRNILICAVAGFQVDIVPVFCWFFFFLVQCDLWRVITIPLRRRFTQETFRIRLNGNVPFGCHMDGALVSLYPLTSPKTNSIWRAHHIIGRRNINKHYRKLTKLAWEMFWSKGLCKQFNVCKATGVHNSCHPTLRLA